AKKNLVVLIRIHQKIGVIDFYYERNFMRVFSRYHRKHAKGGSHRVAAAFNSQLHYVFGIEINGVGSKRSSGRMFNTLVNRQNGNISASCQTTGIMYPRKTVQHLIAAVGNSENSVHKIGTRQVQMVFADGFTLMI